MRVIVYKPSKSERSASLARQVHAWTRPFEVFLCTTPQELAGLVDALEHGRNDDLVLLLLEERSHLNQMRTLRDRLSERQCIVVLPDFDRESLTVAHSLYPRFLTGFAEPPERLGAILARIVCRRTTTSVARHDLQPPEPAGGNGAGTKKETTADTAHDAGNAVVRKQETAARGTARRTARSE
jgi:hypothetical protein